MGTVALPGIAVIGWTALGEPEGFVSLAALLAPAIVLGIMLPAILASLGAVPGLLVPRSAIIWWRCGSEDRPAIRAWLRRAVLAADGYRCCWCEATEELQLDHYRPWSRGGLTAFWNMLTLCGRCNRIKSNCWVARDGYVFYRPFKDAGNRQVALDILAYERWHRWNLMRWIRAGWSIGS